MSAGMHAMRGKKGVVSRAQTNNALTQSLLQTNAEASQQQRLRGDGSSSSGADRGGGEGGAAKEGPDSAHDIILEAVLTKDVGPLLQAINNFCRG